MPTGIRLLAGLGNPGSKYSETRHNAGFWFLQQLAEKYGSDFRREDRFFCEALRLNQDDIDCRLIKPLTYMNESGRSIQAIMDYYDILPGEILVVHDEIDLDPGIVRFKRGGGHGGHNGLRDIISTTGSKEFLRLRIGVGHPGHRDEVTPYVLGRPSAHDRTSIDVAIDRAVGVMSTLFRGEFNKLMNELHKNENPEQESRE